MTAVKKMKNILVATDFSGNSDLAISSAMDIAKATNANLTILHVVQEKSMDRFLDNTLKKFLPKALWLTTEEQRALALKEKMDLFARPELKMQSVIVKKGKPAVKILHYAKRNKVDLLVVGGHGNYSFRDTFVGTTAEYLADKTSCPVLIVKSKSKNLYRNILVPTDFSLVSKKALHCALKLFPQGNFHLLHVGDYAYENLLTREKIKSDIPKNKIIKIRRAILFYLENNMKLFLKGCGKKIGKFSSKVVLGYPGPTILKEAKQSKCSIIAMGTQGHSRHHAAFMGSVAKRVLMDCDKDILLVPPR